MPTRVTLAIGLALNLYPTGTRALAQREGEGALPIPMAAPAAPPARTQLHGDGVKSSAPARRYELLGNLHPDRTASLYQSRSPLIGAQYNPATRQSDQPGAILRACAHPASTCARTEHAGTGGLRKAKVARAFVDQRGLRIHRYENGSKV